MDGVSLSNATLNVLQAAAAQTETQDSLQVAVLAKAQDVQQQQGSAAVQLIEAATQIVDVRV